MPPTAPTRTPDRTRTRPWTTRAGRVVCAALLGVAAAGTAVVGFGGVDADVGPLTAQLHVVLSPGGGTEVDLAPLGRIDLPTHAGPLGLRARVEDVRAGEVGAFVEQGLTSGQAREQVTADLRTAVEDLAVRCALVGLLAAVGACALVFRRWRPVAVGAGAAAVALGICAVVATATFRTGAVTEPTFTGLLTRAPAVISAVADTGDAAEAHARRLGELTGDIAQLYTVLSEPEDDPPSDAVRVLFVSDIHNNPAAYEVMSTLVERFDVAAIIDSGDSTDLGTPAENPLHTAKSGFGVPYVWVRGNHDSNRTQEYMVTLPGVTVLDDGAITEVAGLRIAGTGDPEFTPVKQLQVDTGSEQELAGAGAALAEAVQASAAAGRPVHLAVVHEPRMAGPLHGVVPLVLDGHVHQRRSQVVEGTLELTQGSSGGAGLRAFDSGQALPLTMSVLHFDAGEGELLAVDDVTLSGPGQRSVTLERHDASSYAEDEAAAAGD
ncbi:metallophosphoesterase family protein [Aquipuribacter hungaricus]|uniref:Metallophosphoesterase family protein n=1 Tax=Aquipuribacter hungaricus TaxID=545624 RepID=A0ABV7WMK9_9MICO